MIDLTGVSGDFYRINFDVYFVESPKGNYVWNVQEHQLVVFNGSYFNYLNDNHLIKAKYFGYHKLLEYCDNPEVVDKTVIPFV